MRRTDGGYLCLCTVAHSRFVFGTKLELSVEKTGALFSLQ